MTQTARYTSPEGLPLQAGQHRKTKKATERTTNPLSGPDGQGPNAASDHEQDEEQQED